MSEFVIKKAPSAPVIPHDSIQSFFSDDERAECVEISAEFPVVADGEKKRGFLYILPSAFEELNAHIEWKHSTARNRSEQGGVLVGNVFAETETDRVCGVVSRLISVEKSGDATYIQFSHSDWIKIYNEFERLFPDNNTSKRPLEIIGWYHTHPNMPVRMSGIDKQTHKNFFPEENLFSVIFNPQRAIWAVFNGTECENCEGVLFYGKNMKFPEPLSIRCGENETGVEDELEAGQGAFAIKKVSGTPEFHTADLAANSVRTVSAHREEQHSGLGVQYRGYSQRIKNEYYYFPFHNVKKYANCIISDDTVRKITDSLSAWSFSDGQSVTLIYAFETANVPLCKNMAHAFYPIKLNAAAAKGVTCSKNEKEYLAYATNRSSNLNVKLLAVRFSQSLPNYRYLRNVYGEYDSVLWVNARNVNDFLFFNIDDLDSIECENPGFNIKNRTLSEKMVNDRTFLQLGKTELKKISDAIAVYIPMPLNDSNLLIPFNIVESILKKIKKYGKFEQTFYIALTFPMISRSNTSRIIPLANDFIDLAFLTDNNQCCVFKFPSCGVNIGSNPKVAFIITNTDDRYNLMECRLTGCGSFFYYNVESGKHSFYHGSQT